MAALAQVTAAHVAAASARPSQAPPPRRAATSYPTSIVRSFPDPTLGGRFELTGGYIYQNLPMGSTRSPLSFMEAVFNTVEYQPDHGVALGWRNPDVPLREEVSTRALAPVASPGVADEAALGPALPVSHPPFNVLPSTGLDAPSDDDADLFGNSPSDTE